eukprot:6523943-Prymnesium_polylepis.1
MTSPASTALDLRNLHHHQLGAAQRAHCAARVAGGLVLGGGRLLRVDRLAQRAAVDAARLGLLLQLRLALEEHEHHVGVVVAKLTRVAARVSRSSACAARTQQPQPRSERRRRAPGPRSTAPHVRTPSRRSGSGSARRALRT